MYCIIKYKTFHFRQRNRLENSQPKENESARFEENIG